VQRNLIIPRQLTAVGSCRDSVFGVPRLSRSPESPNGREFSAMAVSTEN
jgi:hypothetical protein